MKNFNPAFWLVFLLAGCTEPTVSTPPPRPALVAVVGGQVADDGMSLVGEVLPRFESSQGFRIGGKIIERKIEVGDTVKKGQALARLDPSDAGLNVSSAKADIVAAEASVELAGAEFKRYQKLFAQKFVSASALDVKDAELKTAKAKLAQLKAKAEVSVNEGKYTYLKADRDGLVTEVKAEPGQVVEAGEVIAKIADKKNLDVLVAVPESEIAKITLHGSAKIKLWANQERVYVGNIREIAPAADPATRAFNTKIAFADADDAIKWGMTVRVKFDQPEDAPDAGLWVPLPALTEINGKPHVWVIGADNKAQAREVTTGQFTEHGVAIKGGVAAGEKVAVAGVHTLVQGQEVRPLLGDVQ